MYNDKNLDRFLEAKRALPMQKKQVLAAKQNAISILTKATRLQDAIDKEDDSRNNGIIHKAISALVSIRHDSFNIVKKTHDKNSLVTKMNNIKRYYNEVRQIIDKLNIEFKYKKMLGDLETEMEKTEKALRTQHQYMDPEPQSESEYFLNNITNKGENKMELITREIIEEIVEAVIAADEAATDGMMYKENPNTYGNAGQMHKKDTAALQSFRGKEFVITGKFSGAKRADVEAAIRERGGKVAKAVTRNTYCVVVGNKGSPTWSGGDDRKAKGGNKIQAANRLGIKTFMIGAFISKTGLKIPGYN